MSGNAKTPPIGDGRGLKCVFAWTAIAHQLPHFLGIEQAKNLAVLAATIDPAALVALCALLWEGARQ
jgi:hypothetical protein